MVNIYTGTACILHSLRTCEPFYLYQAISNLHKLHREERCLLGACHHVPPDALKTSDPQHTAATVVCSAMAYLHSLDILHGDLSSNNVLLACNSDDQRGFTAKVADFGLARMLPQGDTIQTRAIGTITHMPPELMLEGQLNPFPMTLFDTAARGCFMCSSLCVYLCLSVCLYLCVLVLFA